MTPEERARRRALIKAHHPDRGGDPARFVELLDALDRDSTSDETDPHVLVHPSTSRRRRRRQAVRRLRAALPRRAPGARRYGQY